MKIAVLCPSRGRPELAKRMEDSFYANSSDATVFFYLNDDDERLGDYKVRHRYVRHNSPTHATPIAFATNHLYQIVRDSHEWDAFLFCGDDALLKTEGWDTSVDIRSCIYKDGIWAAGFYDGREFDSYPHPMVSRRWAEVLGYVVPPWQLHWGIDTVTQKMAESIKRFIKFDSIWLDHETCKTGKTVVDDTHRGVRDGMWHARDMELIQMDRLWKAEAETLRGVIDG
jgi:hypothetical protein